jgi:hypothetical protein
MYVFEGHICFYSNVFGFVKKKVIDYKVCQLAAYLRQLLLRSRLAGAAARQRWAGARCSARPAPSTPAASHRPAAPQEILSVRKKAHMGFPNSIEVRRAWGRVQPRSNPRRRPLRAGPLLGPVRGPARRRSLRHKARQGRPCPCPPSPPLPNDPGILLCALPLPCRHAAPPALPLAQIELHGQSEFFTSFLSREDAYRLVANTWQAAM